MRGRPEPGTDLVGTIGLRWLQRGGGKPGSVYRGGARHRLPAQVQAQAHRNPAGGPPQPHPPNPRDAFAKALGAISPAVDRQSTVR